MKRRTFIFVSTASILATSSYLYFHYFKGDDDLIAYIKSLKGLDEIGAIYKQSYLRDDYLNQLTHKIKQFNDVKTIQEKVIQSINYDMKNKKFCQIDGWQLSETECLLAASFVSFTDYIKPKDNLIVQDFTNARTVEFLTIKNWGPQKTFKGVVFNKQTDGHAGIWFVVDNPPPNLKVIIGGDAKTTTLNERSITSGIHDLDKMQMFLNNVGKHEIAIYDKINHRKQIVGYFEVLPIPEKLIYPDGTKSKVFCPIENWGPQQAQKNKAFNRQPNGYAAIWIKTKCAPLTTKVLINNISTITTVRPDIITASVPITDLISNKDAYKVELFDAKSKEKLTIGEIQVTN